jgi:hypothetical protein
MANDLTLLWGLRFTWADPLLGYLERKFCLVPSPRLLPLACPRPRGTHCVSASLRQMAYSDMHTPS